MGRAIARGLRVWGVGLSVGCAAGLVALPTPVPAWNSADGSAVVHGYLDNSTYQRNRSGLSKMRNRAVAEFTKDFGAAGPFSSIRLNGTFRATYDAVYDLNDDQWGDESGGPVTLENLGGPLGVASGSALTAAPFINSAARVNWGEGFGSQSNPPPPGFFDFFLRGFPGTPGINGGGFGFDTAANPNAGLRVLGREDFNATGGLPGFGGVNLAYPTRPCDV
ncbi:MAG: hypothetical protein ACREXT_05925, partial [Gammaproteobacteria bacterium]